MLVSRKVVNDLTRQHWGKDCGEEIWEENWRKLIFDNMKLSVNIGIKEIRYNMIH